MGIVAPAHRPTSQNFLRGFEARSRESNPAGVIGEGVRLPLTATVVWSIWRLGCVSLAGVVRVFLFPFDDFFAVVLARSAIKWLKIGRALPF